MIQIHNNKIHDIRNNKSGADIQMAQTTLVNRLREEKDQ